MSEEKTPLNMCAMSEKLIGYLYRELSAEEAAAFEAHAKTCARCAQDLRDFERVRRALAEWRIPSAPQAAAEPEGELARPSLRHVLRQLFRVMPAWGRALLAGATVLLLLALFNVHLEWMPGGGFRFRAGLFPPRAAEPEMSAREHEQMQRLIEGMLRDLERRQEDALAARLHEVTERLRQEQRAALADVVQKWNAEQRAQWALLLREVERRRYGALTFADLFFSGQNGN